MARAFLFAALVAASIAHAATFRWAAQGDHLTADPHAQDALLTNAINLHVYEPLVMRDKALRIIPALATGWRQASATQWIFTLRRDVRWHDGSPFTADDVVFSYQRAQGMTSNYKGPARSVGTAQRVDDHTVSFTTREPNPVLLETVAGIMIMNRAWCAKHKAEMAQDFGSREETFAARNAMGTGPFVLVARAPDVKTTFRKNPAWWGIREGLFDGNVDLMEFSTIRSDATRMSALRSGELHLVHDPPPQDLGALRGDSQFRIIEGPENSILFIGMDQARAELVYSDVKGRNPFKDRRVRLAMYQALDVEALNRVVNRGTSITAAVPLPNPAGAGIPPDLIRRYAYDVEAAKKLMADAGWQAGFGITFDCLTTREKLCVAIAAMWARIGIKAKVNAMPSSLFIARGQRMDTSLYMLGWGGASGDAIFLLQPVFHGRNDRGDGDSNWGNYRDEELDKLIDAARVEVDGAKRQGLINRAMVRIHEGVYYIPLQHRIAPWVARANVSAVHRANNHLNAIWVTVR